MVFDPVRDAAMSPPPPSPSVRKGSLQNILNDDPALDPALRSPSAAVRSPVFAWPSPRPAPQPGPMPPPVARTPPAPALLYLPPNVRPSAPPLRPVTPRQLDILARSRNWLRKNVDRASLPPFRPLTPPGAAPTPPFSDVNGIGYYLRPAPAHEHSGGSPAGGYSPSRPTSAKRARDDEHLPTPPPKRQALADDSKRVAGHYNARPDVGREARKQSPILGLKNFNNWVKSALIHKCALSGPDVRVLDMGCGKGGDLLKWSKKGIKEYIGLDVAAVSVNQARDRWLEIRGKRFAATFEALDCFEHSIRKVLSPRTLDKPFHNVTMQFCMHYAFSSEACVRQMLENASTNLITGGRFIGTIPNAELILSKLPDDPAEPPSFGNPVFRITFPTRPPPPPQPDDPDQSGAFGHKYAFWLQDAVGEGEEGVPEYLVHWSNFARIAQEYGLYEIYRKDFADVLEEGRDDRELFPLLKRMNVIDDNGESDMDEDQWEAAGLYLAFAFEKK